MLQRGGRQQQCNGQRDLGVCGGRCSVSGQPPKSNRVGYSCELSCERMRRVDIGSETDTGKTRDGEIEGAYGHLMALGGLVDDVVLRTLKPPSTEPLPPYNRTTYILVHGSRLGAGAPHCH